MFRWHRLGQVFWDDEGGGGGAAEPADQPAYEVPPEVPRGPSGYPLQQPQEPPSEPEGQPPEGTAPDASSEQIPKHRLDEAIAQRDNLYQVVQRQQQQIDLLMQRMAPQPPQAPAQPAAQQLNEADLKIRERLYAVIPQLKMLDQIAGLVEKRDAILGAAEAVPAWQSAETQYWDRYAENSHGSIADQAAEYLLGKGKAAKDLNPMTAAGLRSAFIQWVVHDPSRAARYEREDPSLPKEFWGAYRAAVYDPIRREAPAHLLTQQPPRIPQGGGGAPAANGSPPAARQPAAPVDDDDAIHRRAWAMRDTVAPR